MRELRQSLSLQPLAHPVSSCVPVTLEKRSIPLSTLPRNLQSPSAKVFTLYSARFKIPLTATPRGDRKECNKSSRNKVVMMMMMKRMMMVVVEVVMKLMVVVVVVMKMMMVVVVVVAMKMMMMVVVVVKMMMVVVVVAVVVVVVVVMQIMIYYYRRCRWLHEYKKRTRNVWV